MATTLTASIVDGYIHQAINSFSNDLKKIILSFIKSFEENSGIHRITINDLNLMHKMLNAKCKEKFEMESFILSRVKCRLVIYPNGDKPELEGYFVLHLFMDLPEFIDTITFSRMFRVKEACSSSLWLTTLSNGDYEYWSKYCALSDITMNHPISLNIEIELNIHEITLKNDTYLSLLSECKLPATEPLKVREETNIKYILTAKEVEMLYKCKPGGKSLCSDIVDNMWSLLIEPRVHDPKHIELYIRMGYIPSNVESFHIGYEIECKELNKSFKAGKDVLFTREDSSWGPNRILVRTEDIDGQFEKLTFTANIQVKSVGKYREVTPLVIQYPSQIAYLLSL